jgi:hypothetical protein
MCRVERGIGTGQTSFCSRPHLHGCSVYGLPPAGIGYLREAMPGTNKAGMSFRIRGWDSETHETHKDCDKQLLHGNFNSAGAHLPNQKRTGCL